MTPFIQKLKQFVKEQKRIFLALLFLNLFFVSILSLYQIGLFKKRVEVSSQVMKTINEVDYDGRRPSGLEYYKNGNVLVVVPSKRRVYTMNKSGEILSSLKINLNGIWDVAWTGNALWVGDLLTKKLWKINITTGERIRSISGDWILPYGLSWGNNSLWLSDPEIGTIMRINTSTGTIIESNNKYGAALGLAYYRGELWINTETGAFIRQVNASTFELIKKFYSPGPSPSGIAIEESNIVYIGDIGYKIVSIVDPFAPIYKYKEANTPPWLYFLYGFCMIGIVLSLLMQ